MARFEQHVIEDIDIFKCPICGKKMAADELKRIFCLNGHSFDLSKNGYVNLLPHQAKTGYDKKMFAARRHICTGGFFVPLHRLIKEYIIKDIAGKKLDRIRLLDVGCGEGSHLAQLIDGLPLEIKIKAQGAGIDISKEGIQMAAKNYARITWCVANLADVPFINKQFQVLLNILSPANYAEFKRIITDDGLLIKVVPGDNYLAELRRILYYNTSRQTYTNKQTVELLGNNFSVSEIKHVCYKTDVARENLQYLVRMTPLVWGAVPELIERLLISDIRQVTVDLTVLFGKKI